MNRIKILSSILFILSIPVNFFRPRSKEVFEADFVIFS